MSWTTTTWNMLLPSLTSIPGKYFKMENSVLFLVVYWYIYWWGKEPSFSTAKTELLKQNRAIAQVTVIGHFHSPVTQA